MVSLPKKIIHIDYLNITSGKTDKDINLLVITYHITGYDQDFVIS